ncbi:MAG TPA: rhomboid family intramembrane serine protease [Bryobacteraceae bacterium]|nr:rhomboid family intramembrane serine protease [Bryobacteraceae bacterium]
MDKRRMCPHCRAFITTSDRTCPYCHETVGRRGVDERSSSAISGIIPQIRFNTVIILIINFGLYAATSIYSMNSGRGSAMGLDTQTLIMFGGMDSQAIHDYGEWWRLVTAGFLHGGLLHILMNSWVLFDLGPQVEEFYGASRMLTIYFISTVSGFYLSSIFNPGPSIGASAALCGLIGAMIALGLRDRTSVGAAIRSVYIRWVIYILLFSLIPGLGVDLAAHVGGLAGGFAVGYLAGERRYASSSTEMLWRISASCCLLLTAASFLMLYLWFSHNSQ